MLGIPTKSQFEMIAFSFNVIGKMKYIKAA